MLIEEPRRRGQPLVDGRRLRNIIDASFEALIDAVIYKLLKNRDLAGLVAAE